MTERTGPEANARWCQPLVAGRVALVTGGAGAIARATAEALSAHGADILIADIDGDRTHEVVSALRRQGGSADGFVADLTAAGAVERAVEMANDVFGRVDILVNALGDHLGILGPLEESTPDEWQRLYEINLLHVFRASRAVLPAMRKRRWGRIINFSSVEGRRGMPHAAPYTAFKGALDSFTKSLAVEVASDNIRVNAIAVDKTRSYQTGFYELPNEYDPHIPVWVPAGRLGEGDDVAAVALFLASDLCSWVVGQTIAADGGTLAAAGWFPTPNRWTNSPLLVQYFEDSSVTALRPPRQR